MSSSFCPVDRLFAVDYDEWVEATIRDALSERVSRLLEFDLFDVQSDRERLLVTVGDVLGAGVECTTSLEDFVARLDAARVRASRVSLDESAADD